jgi:hypothetical protein
MLPKNVGFLTTLLMRFSPGHEIASDSAKTDEKPGRRTGAEKCVSFRGVLKRHLSVVF